MEKCVEEEYLELKKAAKNLKDQVKDYEERYKNDLMADNDYVELLKLKMEAEEKMAQNNQKLFELITEMPPKPINFKLDMEEGNMNIDIMPEMRVYLNGREEKKRA
jgi:hypothetical protein